MTYYDEIHNNAIHTHFNAKLYIKQLGGVVVKMLACCARGPGFYPQAENPKNLRTFISKIPAGCRSDETLNWRSLVPVSMLGK